MERREYEVQLSEVAERVYERIFRAAKQCQDRGDDSNSHVKQLRIIDEVLDRIIPHDPFAPERRLSGDLSGIYRVKKGRMRICYVGDQEERVILVIYISERPRKAGDRNDPYRILAKLIRSGDDEFLNSLGLTKPLRRMTANLPATSLLQ